jgi:hypothetical protein
MRRRAVRRQGESMSQGAVLVRWSGISVVAAWLAACSSSTAPAPVDMGRPAAPPDLAGPSMVSVAVMPSNASLGPGQMQTFVATVSGAADTTVSWSVTEAGGGTVDANGIYTAPAATGTYHVVATSHADPSASARATVTVSAAPQVGIAISPTSATIPVGGSQSFTATVTGASDTSVLWSVMELAGGTVANGVYSAPSTAGVYHVIAASHADPTKMAIATVTVTVALTLAPPSATLNAGQKQTFVANVSGSSNAAVTWAVVEPGGGLVDASGTYTAPSALGVYHVKATASADTTVSATATVTVTATPQIAVTIAPGRVTLDEGGTQSFTTTVSNPGGGSTAATYAVLESGGGAISAGGGYTAPLHGGLFHVIATSVADASKTAVAVVTVNQAMISLDVNSATLDQGASLTLHATLTGIADNTVDWSVTESGGGAVASGVYTAPLGSGTFHVVARSHADPTLSATATVTVRAVSVVLDTTSITLDQAAMHTFIATVTGSTVTTVSWTATCGTIDTAGNYSAPDAAPGALSCSVTATSGSDGTRATATVSVNAVALAVTEPTLTLDQGATHTFAATLSGIAIPSLTWSQTCARGSASITSGGLFTAPTVQGSGTTCTVTATAADGAASSSTVTIRQVSIVIAPGAATLAPNQSASFTALVSGTVDTVALWSVVQAGGGTVNGNGLYYAPSSTGSFTVKAVAHGDPTQSANATANVTTTIAVSVAPGAVTLGANQQQSFSATVTGAINGAVTWSASAGSIAQTGVFTAPASTGTVTVTATSLADRITQGTATVTVVTTPQITVSVSPPTAQLAPLQQERFTATVQNGTTQNVTWSVVEGAAGGSVDTSGNYSAPQAAGTYHLVATSVDNGTSTATATITVSTGPPISVTVTPGSVTLGANGTQTFVASVTGTPIPQVIWSLGAGSVGTLTATGLSALYTAPNAASGSATVIATSVADSTRSAKAAVSLTGSLSVTVSPPMTALRPGDQQAFSATLIGGAGTPSWSIDPACLTAGGSIGAASGVFSAPPSAPITCTIFVNELGAQGSASASVVSSSLLTVSGTVSYATRPRSGSIFLSLVEAGSGGNVLGGTHLFAPGPFLIRGVRPNGGAKLIAWDDAGGMVKINYAIDQTASTLVPPAGGNMNASVSGLSLVLADPTPVVPAVAPTLQGAFTAPTGMGLVFTRPVDGNGNEIADHYTVYVSTDATPGPTDNVMTRVFQYWTRHIGELYPLAAGSYYVAIRAGNPAGEGPLSAPSGPFAVGAASGPGPDQVSGTVDVPASLVPSGPLFVGIGNFGSTGTASGVHSVIVQNVGAVNPFTVSGASDGRYEMFATLDQLADGNIGPLDPNMNVPVTVSGNTTLPTLTFPSGNATLSVSFNNQCDGSAPSANCSGSGTQTNQFSTNLGILPAVKLPVAATLVATPPGVTGAVPMDLGIDVLRQDSGGLIDQEWIQLGGYVPQIGDPFTVTVTYLDGSVENLQATVSFLPPYPILNATTGNPPQFSWVSPLSGGMELGDLEVIPQIGFSQIWQYNFTDSFALPPVVYAGTALTTGQTYRWTLFTRDQNGNRGQAYQAFVAP